jgi:membrane-associated HD superfamily phosphohydrolase
MSRLFFSLTLVFAFAMTLNAQEIRLNPPLFALLINDAVIKELKVTAEQQEQLKGVLGDFIQEVNGQKRIVIQGGTDIDSLEADSLKVLNEKQTKRLREAWLQVNGAMAITDAKLAKDLSITEEQTKKATEAIQKMNESMRDAFRAGGEQEEITAKVKQLRAETKKVIEGLLTAEQKTKLTTLQGAKIEGLIKP